MNQTMYKLGRRVRTFFRWIDKNYYKILAAIVVIILWWLVSNIVDYLYYLQSYYKDDFQNVRVWMAQ